MHSGPGHAGHPEQSTDPGDLRQDQGRRGIVRGTQVDGDRTVIDFTEREKREEPGQPCRKEGVGYPCSGGELGKCIVDPAVTSNVNRDDRDHPQKATE